MFPLLHRPAPRRAIGTLVLAVTALVSTSTLAVPGQVAHARPYDAQSDAAPVAKRSLVKVTLKVPATVPSKSPVGAVVRLRWNRQLPKGVVLLRVDGKPAGKARVAGGHKHARVSVTLKPLRQGAHHVSAAFRAGGRLMGRSAATRVTSRSGCAPSPSSCGYPDATNTGVAAGASLRTIDGDVTISQDGAVFENAVVNGGINIDADNVTVRNVRINESGQNWGIGLMHTNNTTISNCEIASDGTRLEVGIKDVYGDATGTTIRGCDIADTGTGIQTHEGLIADNYIHDMGYQDGDHINGTTSNGDTTPLTIQHNTIFNQFEQTDAISLFQDFGLEANRTITDNLLAGGGYTIYGGAGGHGTSHHIVITGNRFARIFFPNGGSYGPVAHFESSGEGNIWSGNVWDSSGAAVSGAS